MPISPDLEAGIKRGTACPDLILLEYEFEGEPARYFYMSKDYASGHGIKESVCLSLPDDYPQYVLNAVPICWECFSEYAGNKLPPRKTSQRRAGE